MRAEPARVVIVGGGYAGMNTARRLRATLPADEATITVVDPRSYMTYQPFLAEAAAGSVEPRHMVVPLREVLPGCHVLAGEAIYLRNHVLSRLDAAASTLDDQLRQRLLTFLFVGGGYAGVEAMAELADMAGAATRYYDTISRDDLRWVLVEAADGDAASVPDISRKGRGEPCAPSAQHAARQAKRLASNIAALLRGQRLRRYKHAYAGSVASLGPYHGVAEIYGVRIKGVSAWALHRLYHLATMPTWHRKVRIAFDWLLSLPFRRQIVAMGELHDPRGEFGRAAGKR